MWGEDGGEGAGSMRVAELEIEVFVWLDFLFVRVGFDNAEGGRGSGMIGIESMRRKR